MSITIVTERDFVVAQQQSGRFTPHIFRNEPHFRAWCAVHYPANMVNRGHARGSCLPAIDHRNEIDRQVDDREDELRETQSQGAFNMPTIDQLFPRKYLTGADLQERACTVTIKRVISEEMQPDPRAPKESKYVVYFEGKEKGLILGSKILFEQIATATGAPDTDDWPGQRITIYPEPMVVASKPRIAIRARAAEPVPASE